MSAEIELAQLEAQILETGDLGDWLAGIDVLRLAIATGTPVDMAAALALELPAFGARVQAGIFDAYRAGVSDARALLEVANAGTLPLPGRPSKTALELVKGIDKAGAEALAKARQLHSAGVEAETVLSPIFGHANSVRGRVTESINMSGNEGVTDVADEANLPTVWVAETDACVHCLAYSGRVAKPGKDFPGGLTYGKKSYHLDPLPHPPLHPRCRCTVEPLNSQEYADALRREADRSVLRGFSLESESMGTRIDAAERLLKTDVDAPASVIKYSERSVKAGKFPTRGRPLDGDAPPPPKAGPVPPNSRPPGTPPPKTTPDPSTPNLNKLPKNSGVSPAAAATTSNPGNGLKGYDVNCYSAVSTAELRTRGYDVTAIKAPNARGATPTEIASRWDDPAGGKRAFTVDKTRAQIEAELADWPPDARGFVAIQWADSRSGHIYSVHKTKDGSIIYTDPQKPLKVDAGDYLDRAMHNRIGLFRVDDLLPTDDLADWVVPNDAATNAKLEAAAAKKAAVKAQLDAARAEYDRLDAASKVYFGTTEEGRTQRLVALLAKNAAATAYNDLLKAYKRL